MVLISCNEKISSHCIGFNEYSKPGSTSHGFFHCGNTSCPLELEVGQSNLHSFLFNRMGSGEGALFTSLVIKEGKLA